MAKAASALLNPGVVCLTGHHTELGLSGTLWVKSFFPEDVSKLTKNAKQWLAQHWSWECVLSSTGLGLPLLLLLPLLTHHEGRFPLEKKKKRPEFENVIQCIFITKIIRKPLRRSGSKLRIIIEA